jgi:TolB-like protein/Flp pilus assembly protein TadD
VSLFNELKRRNVFKVAAAYIIVGWLTLQVGEVLSPALHLPEWIISALAFFIILGFPLALIFAWAFEMTPEGLKKEKDVDRSQSITQVTGQKLNFTIIALLVLALGYFAADKFILHPDHDETARVTEPGVQSIAVLPLADMSAGGDNEYFADGLSEELLNILAQNRQLRVAGRTSSFAFKGRNEDLREIGQKLDVETILEGSVRKDDARNRVRITLQLINAEDGYHLWSETYDRDLDDIFAIQEEVAEQVANALQVTLLGEEASTSAKVAKTDYSAYDLYLHGLQALNEYSYASLEQAADSFQQALSMDPGYTPAQIGLISSWIALQGTGAVTREEAEAQVKPLLNLLLEQHPDNSNVHTLKAWVHRGERDWEAVEASYRRALEIDPRNVEALNEFGAFLRDRERLDEGIRYTNRAASLDPFNVQVQWDLSWYYMWTGDLESSLLAAERIREIEPNNPMGYYGPSQAYQIAGNLPQAVAWETRAHEFDPDDYELSAELAGLWLSLGDVDMAEQWLQKTEAVGGSNQPRPIAYKVDLLNYKEQDGLAAQLAATALQLPNRFFSRSRIRNAYVAHALKNGDSESAIEAYRIDNPDWFEDPMRIDLDRVSWSAGELVEMAVILKAGNLMSEDANRFIEAAQTVIDKAHPTLVPWFASVNLAGLEVARGNSSEALRLLRRAFVDENMRMQWRFYLQHWFVLEPLHDESEYRELVASLDSEMEQQREQAFELLEAGP